MSHDSESGIVRKSLLPNGNKLMAFRPVKVCVALFFEKKVTRQRDVNPTTRSGST